MSSSSVHARRAFAPYLVLGNFAVVLALSACSSDKTTGPNVITPLAGTRIVYSAIDMATGFGTTYTVDPSGENKLRLSDPGTDEILPVLSPDGGSIAMVRLVGELPQIFVMRQDGSEAHVVRSIDGGAFFPSWSPDAQRLVVGNYGDAKAWVMTADGSGAHAVVEGEEDQQLPALSPDGHRIVFTSARNFGPTFAVFELYVMDMDGNNVQRLTSSPDSTYGYNAYAAWSPDGSQIAFIRSVNGSVPHLWVMNSDGTGMRQLLNGDLADFGVAWSPDGKQLAVSRDAGFGGDIFIANADGSGLKNVTRTPDVDEQYPHWGLRKF
jgi:Tol biopolymer transport system component